MVVKLSSLKVGADFDASGYERGARAKIAADQQMIAADTARLKLLTQSDMALASIEGRLRDYTAAVNDSTRAVSSLQGQDPGRSLALTGIEFANIADKAKLATVALYALSPGFRELVNPAITAGVRALGPAAVGAAGAAFSAFSPLLSTIGRLALPIAVATESFRAMEAITALGADKLKEFNELANGAGTAGVSTDFWQRQSAGAKELGIQVNEATDAVKKFRDVDQAALGGSGFQQRLDQLQKAGNFAGNGGVTALSQATDVESRYRAAVELISTAIDRGQRLAGLDLASKFLPPEMLDRLRASGSALRELQAAADETKPADIVDAAQISYALELNRRLDDANEIISNGLKPVQKDLTQLGLNYQESWVSIREAMAGGVTHANELYSALKGIPDLFVQAGSASFWTKLTEFTGRMGLNSSPESIGAIMPGQPGYNEDPARASLAAGLRNQAAVQRAMQQATNIQSALRGDTSVNPTDVTKDANDAVDRALDTLRKHVEMQKADAAAAGLGAAALARFRAEAAETAAAQANGGKETAEQARQFAELRDRAAAAAEALERARINQAISFGRQTALLSPDDVSIAQQLKGLYPDVAQALGSVEASALRTNTALSQASSTISGNLTTGIADAIDGTKTFGTAMADTGKLVIRALEEMIVKLYVVGPLMRGLQSSFGGLGSLFGGSGLPGEAGSAFFGPLAPSAAGNVFTGGNIIPFARGGVVSRPVLFPMANGGTGLMGEAGPEAVMPLRRGSDGRLGVSVHGAAGASGGSSGGDINFTGGITINVPEGTSPTDASTIANTVKNTMRQVAQDEIRQAARSGGYLNSRGM